MVSATRPLLEHGIRKMLLDNYSDRITILNGSVTGFIPGSEAGTLGGMLQI